VSNFYGSKFERRSMKWAVLAALLAAIIPLANWLRDHPREVPKAWMLVGLLPFMITKFHLYMAAISWPGWPGYAKGIEVSVLDILVVALYLGLPRSGRELPFRFSMACYFLAVLLSVSQATVPMAVFFYAWQLARMFLVYAVVTKACATDERVIYAIIKGMGIGLCVNACDVVWQRFGLGIHQAGGFLGNQNLLGLLSHFAVFPWFALLLAGARGWQPVATPIAGLIVQVFTVSRATVGLGGIGYVALFFISAMRAWSARKAIIFMAALLIVAIAAPFIASSFEARFANEVASNYDERAAFQKAATMIIDDHPFGIGANSYVVIANMDGYNTRAGVAAIVGSDSTNVHNLYYLAAAETGYLGLLTLVVMLLQPLIVAIRCAWRYRKDPRSDLLLGLAVALFVAYAHSYFEWVFITFQVQYMFAMNLGLIAGIAMQMGYWRTSHARVRFGKTAPIASAARIAGN
jgi:O-antigen ligase